MRELSIAAAAVTMTSREIAELTGKEHKNVLSDARKMLAELGLTSAEFSADVPDSYGRLQTVLKLPKRETLILVSGYSIEMRARIIDRWQELEPRAVDPMLALGDPATLRQVLLGYTEKVIALEAQVGELRPKAKALDRIATGTDGSFCLTDAAKSLQVQPKRFFARLQEIDFIYRRPMAAGWIAYEQRIKQGLLEHKVTTGEKSDGSEWVSTQVRVTAKGMVKLSELFNSVVVGV